MTIGQLRQELEQEKCRCVCVGGGAGSKYEGLEARESLLDSRKRKETRVEGAR